MRSNRRYSRGSVKARYGVRHVSQRAALTITVAGIDKDIEIIFLNLPAHQLTRLLQRYEGEYGSQALSYARKTYGKWKSGQVKMSGLVAERLLNLVPPCLDAATRFDLVKKLRTAHLRPGHRHLTTAPERWKSDLAPILTDLVQSSSTFRLPEYVINKARWLADGDTDTAQKFLAAAEQEEAVVRLRYLEAEFQRIEFLIQNIKATRSVSHRIELPQGHISITIELPKKTLWQRLLDW